MDAAFLLIDKPAGPTSHDVVDRVRRATGERRVGHAGTLDPFASGLLVVAVGREATREISRFVGLPKSYEATFALGASSDTDDRTGRIEDSGVRLQASAEEIQKAMARFVGDIDQVPPAYAAIKVGGRKMYEAARAGTPIEAKPRRVRIDRFDLLDGPIEKPCPGMLHVACSMLRVRISCSSGTYVRALARDLGAALGTGGYVEALRRTAIGPFAVEESVATDALKDDWRRAAKSLDDLLARLPPPQAPATLTG